MKIVMGNIKELNMEIKKLNESFKELSIKESTDTITLRDAIKEIVEGFEDEDLSEYDESELDEKLCNEVDRALTYNENTIDLWKEMYMSSLASNGIMDTIRNDVYSYLKDEAMNRLGLNNENY
jgi:hypothetical protein